MIELSEAKKHLRVLHNHEDDIIQIYIDAAISRFEQFTGRKLYIDQVALDADSQSPAYTQLINSEIKAGCLILVAHLYVNRDMDADIPKTISYLWQAYWVPMIS